jgi:alanine dehydrogenase
VPGGRVVESADEVFEAAELIVNVKEPIPEEYDGFREGQELFTYLHLAADRELPEFLMERKINALAYEAVELPDGSLPLLAPMSEVAGGCRSTPRRTAWRARRVGPGSFWVATSSPSRSPRPTTCLIPPKGGS